MSCTCCTLAIQINDRWMFQTWTTSKFLDWTLTEVSHCLQLRQSLTRVSGWGTYFNPTRIWKKKKKNCDEVSVWVAPERTKRSFIPDRTNQFQTNRPKLVPSTEIRPKIEPVGSSDGPTPGGTVSSTHRPKTNSSSVSHAALRAWVRARACSKRRGENLSGPFFFSLSILCVRNVCKCI